MPLFGPRRREGGAKTGRPTTPQLRVLRADGQRIDLTTRDVGTRLSATRQSWQADAWDYRDMIGELRYAHRLEARSVAKCRFFAAQVRDYPDDPAELTGDDHDVDEQLAADAVENLARLPLDDDPDGFVATMVENFATPGECWIHGQKGAGSDELWAVRSVSEITAHGDQVMLSELPGASALGQRPIHPKDEELLRCWIRHPRWGQLADSPLRAMLDVLEEIVLTGRESRAASRSRIAANGLLLLPDTLSLVRTRDTEEELEPQSVADDEFMGEFTTAVTAPIANEGHAGAMVPVVLRGSPEALKEVRHLRLDRADAEELMERLNGSVYRMLRGLDIQPERVQGMGDTNHWGQWLIEASDIRHQVEPMAAIVAGCLTKAFLRPALKALQYTDEQIRKVVVWYDASELVENPNRGQDSRDAHASLVISDARHRQDLGYTEDDAPDEDELHRRIAAKTVLDPATAAVVLDLTKALQQGGQQPRVIDAQPANALPAGQSSNGKGARPAGPGQVVPEKTVPEQRSPDGAGPGGMVAAADPGLPDGWRVDLEAARALAEVDAALLERILTAADAAIARAVERAGGRARNAIRSDQSLAASLAGVKTTLVPFTLGRVAVLAAASLPDLLSGAYDRLQGQFRTWLGQAAKAAADASLRVLGLDRRSTAGRRVHEAITTRLEVHRDAAWVTLAEALDAAAERALFRADPLTPEPSQGEDSGTLIEPAAVARALVIAGGGQPGRTGDGGLGTGPVVRGALGDEGAILLGHEWQYRPERLRNTFPPHLALDGTRFQTWTDPKLDTRPEHRRWLGGYYHPQDHPNCRCWTSPIYAVPEPDDDGIVLRRLREAQKSQRGQLAAEVAAEDAAAGRRGTSLQNEVEARDRITAGVERLRAHYIEQGGREWA